MRSTLRRRMMSRHDPGALLAFRRVGQEEVLPMVLAIDA
jgi:hypothetical protein